MKRRTKVLTNQNRGNLSILLEKGTPLDITKRGRKRKKKVTTTTIRRTARECS